MKTLEFIACHKNVAMQKTGFPYAKKYILVVVMLEYNMDRYVLQSGHTLKP